MIAEVQNLPAIARHADVVAALHDASTQTGSDFSYLLSTAMRESGLDTQAKSKTSSASGLFQFIDQTWLGLVKRFGDRYGLANYAGAIQDSGNGHYTVASNDTKAAILALRQDPQLSALMAGEAAKQTKQSLECALGRQVCDGELYAAHFLGEGGARQLIQLRQENPDARADVAFPQAAKANRDAFYHADGSPKTVDELYAWVAKGSSVTTAPASGQGVIVSSRGTSPAQDTGMGELDTPEISGQNTKHFSIAATTASPSIIQVYVKPSGAWLNNIPPATIPANTLPQSSLVLSPGVLEMLAAIMPAALPLRRAT